MKNINAIDLQITNEDGNFVDISGQEMTMKLNITSTYDIIRAWCPSRTLVGQLRRTTVRLVRPSRFLRSRTTRTFVGHLSECPTCPTVQE